MRNFINATLVSILLTLGFSDSQQHKKFDGCMPIYHIGDSRLADIATVIKKNNPLYFSNATLADDTFYRLTMDYSILSNADNTECTDAVILAIKKNLHREIKFLYDFDLDGNADATILEGKFYDTVTPTDQITYTHTIVLSRELLRKRNFIE